MFLPVGSKPNVLTIPVPAFANRIGTFLRDFGIR